MESYLELNVAKNVLQDQGEHIITFIDFDRGSAVKECSRDFWYHQVGTEVGVGNSFAMPLFEFSLC